MIIEQIETGKTVEEAKDKALAELSALVDIDTVDYDIEVLEYEKAKTLGIFGGKEAKVRVFCEVDDPVQETVEQAPVVKKEVAKSAHLTEKTQQKVISYLGDILKNLGVEDATIELEETEEGTKINFDGTGLGTAIGRKGETLDALQHLVSLVANRNSEDYVRVTLNPGEYRQKRETILVNLANKNAKQALKFNKYIALEPMNSYERRIVHNAVQNIEGVVSWSIGEGDARRVCIGTSKDNAPFRQRNSRGSNRNRGGNRSRNGSRRPQREVYTPDVTPRAPKSDVADLPKYGVIKQKKTPFFSNGVF